MNNLKRYFAVVLFSAFALVAQSQSAVSTDSFAIAIKNPDVQILDVRTPSEYNSGHIKSAFLADWLQPEEFKRRVGFLDKSKPVVVYCAAGPRSEKAADWLAKNGFSQVQYLKGGFTKWKLEDKPYEAETAATQLSKKEYDEYLSAFPVVLVDFGAVWCPPCKKMEPVMDSLQKELKNKFKLTNIDGGINTDIMKELNVTVLPTFILYKNGKEVWRKEGLVEKAEFVRVIKDVN